MQRASTADLPVLLALDTDRTITMWMSLVDVSADVGTMTFASGSHLHGDLGTHLIGDGTEATYNERVDRLGLVRETHGALRAGDAPFTPGGRCTARRPTRAARCAPS
jgi:ectoine hydroxylase-related dioxygenase (phytanoyl-CoA dioxygenase family)